MIIVPLLLAVSSLSQFLDQSNLHKGESLKTCTLLGCVTEAVIDIRRADLERPEYEVLIEFDDVEQRCKLPKSEDVAPETANCGHFVRLVLKDVQCTSALSAQECVLTPKVEEHVAIFATPATIKITLFLEGKKIATDTLHPTYETHFPNGEECGHECKTWRKVWTIPGE